MIIKLCVRTLLPMWNLTARQPDWLELQTESCDARVNTGKSTCYLPGRRHSFGEWAYGVGSTRLCQTLALQASLSCGSTPARPHILISVLTHSDHAFLTITRLICDMSSSMEISRFVDVQWYDHWPCGKSCHANFCGHCNSTTAAPVWSISSFMELSWSLNVQWHYHWLIESVGIPVGHLHFFGCFNSTIAGLIRAISNYLEPSWPIDVWQHGHWPVRLVREFPSVTQILADAVTLQALDEFAQSQFVWKHHNQ